MAGAYTYIVEVEPNHEPFAPLKDYDCTITLKETTAEAKTYVITSLLDISNLLNTIPEIISYTAINVITVKRIK
jgi:hypothetical protein